MPLFERCIAETGVKVTYIADKVPLLMERLKAESGRTQADVFITVGSGNLGT